LHKIIRQAEYKIMAGNILLDASWIFIYLFILHKIIRQAEYKIMAGNILLDA